ncbi:MAG: GxxExxY protein [Candidatus Riflebacteria bacterium]|nr:GxxExxY protein [Candidatus Riflebacteria bacterium]
MKENEITEKIISCAIKVHSAIGPGLLESVYERVMAYELEKCGLRIEIQKPISFSYENIVFDEGFRADVLVENCVIIEIKSVKKIEDIHFKQLLSYLKLSKIKLGLLINFNEVLVKDGIKRVINGKI